MFDTKPQSGIDLTHYLPQYRRAVYDTRMDDDLSFRFEELDGNEFPTDRPKHRKVHFDFTGDEYDLAYAAGIIDGEGTIGMNANGTSPYICVVMSDEIIPMWLAETFGGNVYSHQPRYPNSRVTFHWRLGGHACKKVCSRLWPYLKLKRPQAQLVLDYYADPSMERRPYRLTEEQKAIRDDYKSKSHALNSGRGK